LADCLLDSVDEPGASGIPFFLLGHVGGGNFFFGYLLDPESAEKPGLAEKLNHNLVSWALRLEAPAPASTVSVCTRWTSW